MTTNICSQRDLQQQQVILPNIFTERHVIDNHVAVPNFPFEISFTTSALLIHINNRAVSCLVIQSIYDLLVHECVSVDNYIMRNSGINNFFPIYDKVFLHYYFNNKCADLPFLIAKRHETKGNLPKSQIYIFQIKKHI